jgi:hypothetical protein
MNNFMPIPLLPGLPHLPHEICLMDLFDWVDCKIPC